eukprot:1706797-Rhodomonas_salina.4
MPKAPKKNGKRERAPTKYNAPRLGYARQRNDTMMNNSWAVMVYTVICASTIDDAIKLAQLHLEWVLEQYLLQDDAVRLQAQLKALREFKFVTGNEKGDEKAVADMLNNLKFKLLDIWMWYNFSRDYSKPKETPEA